MPPTIILFPLQKIDLDLSMTLTLYPLTLSPEHDILMTNKKSLSKRVQRLLACGQIASQADIIFIS